MRFKPAMSLLTLLLLIAGLALTVYRRLDPGQAEQAFLQTSIPPVQASPSPEVQISPTAKPTLTPAPQTDAPDILPEDILPDIDVDAWPCRLVNRDHPLEADFAPELTGLEGDHSFDSRAIEYLTAFIEDARANQMTVLLTSSYRPYSTQQYLYQRKLNEYLAAGHTQEESEIIASRIVAYPGTSEHQLGLAVDIVDKYYEYMNESYADSPLAQWMKKHCQEYGFILRYPEDKQEITGIMFEPWHFRYVGVEAAEYIMENDLCLEEFHSLYQ